MNLRTLIAAAPWLRRLWRFLPGPLRIPVLVLAAVVWLWRRMRGEEPEVQQDPSADADPA